MKAVILNSGMGSRMGEETTKHPKCMTRLYDKQTILSRQLEQLYNANIRDVVITTGYLNDVLISYCNKIACGLNVQFVNNSEFETTNYIYSLFLAKDLIMDDILLMHGDIVFDDIILEECIRRDGSCMVVDSLLSIPKKDFKAVIQNGKIQKIGVGFYENVVAAQPLYKLMWKDWQIWLEEIIRYCNSGKRECYAENAFNDISGRCNIEPYDVKGKLCREIDTLEDRNIVVQVLNCDSKIE